MTVVRYVMLRACLFALDVAQWAVLIALIWWLIAYWFEAPIPPPLVDES